MDDLVQTLAEIGINADTLIPTKNPIKPQELKPEVKPISKWQKFKVGFMVFWNKTVFSDMINRKREMNQIKAEAKKEADDEIKPILKEKLKEQYKQQQIDNAMGVKKPNDAWAKLAKGFGVDPNHQTNPQQKGNNLSKMMGGLSTSGIISDDKIKNMMSLSRPTQQQSQPQQRHYKTHSKGKRKNTIQPRQKQNTAPPESYSETRIKRMLGI